VASILVLGQFNKIKETNKMKNKVIVLSAMITILGFLTSCTTINPYTGEKEVSGTAVGTGIGVAGGAIVGGLIGGGRGAAIGAAAGGLTGGVIGYSMDRQNQELRQRLVGTGVQVNKVGNTVQLVMASDVTFKFNSADINSAFYSTLDSVAIVLRKYTNTNMVVSGYTDSVGSAAYNQTLSERRAKSVGDYLISQRVNPNRIFTQGFGERNPVASNKTAQGRRMNRRVVITLRPKG
jgi:outer membrane protein OmpA-like peptidoglycan-associated protein